MGKSKRPRPTTQAARSELPVDEPRNTDAQRPLFCLEYIDDSFAVKGSGLSKDAQAAFAERIQELAGASWRELKLRGHHKQGFELLPVGKLRMKMPEAFEDVDRVVVFRYSGMLPMAGVRQGRTFHILAIERQFGELYDHGS